MADKDHIFLIEFVMERAHEATTSDRIRIYRALSDFVGSPEETAELQNLAADLDAADRRCREFAFNFIRKELDR